MMNTNKITFSEGALLTLIPLQAYLMAFLYECGYCAFFDIPPVLINISYSNIIVALGVLISSASGVFLILNSLSSIIKIDTNTPIGRALYRILFPTALFLGLIGLYGKYYKGWLFALIILFFLAFLLFVLPLITHIERLKVITKN